ncbi:hypothetical protein [Rhizobium terrae]|uniref:hypothetical protein n=1 Tax=Rhizobium terrae TaxID=2171756 RepID=UPI0013C303DF|nr:hypothetical protein [Rhizobium terrae]
MVQATIKRSATPLYADDLCQHVFDDLRKDAGVAKESEEGEHIAVIVVELYRQGSRLRPSERQWSRPHAGYFQKQAPV